MEEDEFQSDFEIRKRKNANFFTKRKRDYDLIKPMDTHTVEKKYFIRNILPTSSQDISNGIVPVQQFTLTRSSILKAIEEQAKQNTSLADKYLDVVIRNFHGEFNEVPTSYHEKLINGVLEIWDDWYNKSPNFRDSPLLYMCYICNMGWWRLHPFREHIKEHDVESFDIKPELRDNEFCMIACTVLRRKKPKSTQNLKICSNCWKCGKSATFHNLKSQNAMYKCEGCNIELITCTRLSQHESICKEYLEIKCKKLGIEMSELKICPVCFRCCLTQKQFDVHMIQRHSVHSDDPISIETKICTRCKRKYFIYKYHDCPARYKNTKCEFCFRKFITRSTQLMHIKLTMDANCIVCGESMRECMLLEHMLHHSRNYMLLHYCGKCRKNVLHVNNVYSNNHMKFHGKFVNLKIWSARMLLPIKCVTGEIVDSAAVINIPKKNLAVFMNGLEDEKIIHITSDDSDDNIINLDEDSEPQPDTSEVKNEADECDLNTLQAQLDAEIEKDIEMEAAISNVFKSSVCYQRFLEKENEEPIDDYQFNADRHIIRKPDVTTVMLDTDSDDDNVYEEFE